MTSFKITIASNDNGILDSIIEFLYYKKILKNYEKFYKLDYPCVMILSRINKKKLYKILNKKYKNSFILE